VTAAMTTVRINETMSIAPSSLRNITHTPPHYIIVYCQYIKVLKNYIYLEHN
jgi:hypothetical protein